MADQHPSQDLLLDLALADIDDAGRDALNRHIALCQPCRVAYATLADGIDRVLTAAPSVAPPAGFSGSVLAAMGMGGAESRQFAASTHHGTRWGRPRFRALALVAAAALIIGAGGTAIVMQAYQEPSATVAVGSALLTADGTRVGTVQTSWHGSDPVLVLNVTHGQVGTRYECLLVMADGTRQSGGYWVLREPTGATWVVTRPKAAVRGLELVTSSGMWASAQL